MAGRILGVVGATVVALGAFSSLAPVSATPATDKAEITDVVSGELSALQAVDAIRYASYYCSEWRDQVEERYSGAFTPPDVDRLEGASPRKLRAKVKELFPQASSRSIDAFITAVGDADQDAVDEAWHGLWADTFSGMSYKVKSVSIDVDSPDNAQATIAFRSGGRSGTGHWLMTREDDAWKDCTPLPDSDSVVGLTAGQDAAGLLATPLTDGE